MAIPTIKCRVFLPRGVFNLLAINKKLDATDNEIKILAAFDWHLGAESCNITNIKNIIKWLTEAKNHYIIFGGDTFDMALKDSIAGQNGENDFAKDFFQQLINEVPDFWSKVLAVISGNHEERLNKVTGMDVWRDIIPYELRPHYNGKKFEIPKTALYDSQVISLKLNWGDRFKVRQYSQTILIHHGVGNGATSGAKVNSIEKFDFMEGIDLVLTGHSHAQNVHQMNKLIYDSHRNAIQNYPKMYIICGSQLGWDGYAVKKALRPSTLGNPVIVLKGEKGEIKRYVEQWL